jgi:hypothetical protein
MSLDVALTEAQRVVSDTSALLYRARGARQRLKAEPPATPAEEGKRAVYVMLLRALEEGLYHTLGSAVRALKAARREDDSPAERWLREQLEQLGEAE